MGVDMRITLGYGPSFSDRGYSPDDIELDDDRPHCSGCGAFLGPFRSLAFTYGYPGEEVTITRWGAECRKCGRTNYGD